MKYTKIQWKENKVSINKRLKGKSKVKMRIMVNKRRKANQLRNKVRKITKRRK